jgi:ribosome-binding factor A
MARRGRPQSGRDFPRTARVNELVREIVADSLGDVGGDRVEFITITGAKVSDDLRHAVIYFDTREGEPQDEEAARILGELRVKLQAGINREARIRRTPQLVFEADPAVRGGERIDRIVRGLGAGDAVDDGTGPADADPET